MKKIICLLALSTALVSIHTPSFAAADVLPASSYANPYLADMRAMHPQTYVGYVNIPESQEERKGLYRQGFFDFMCSIHDQTDKTLWQHIHDEGRSIESPTENQISALYMRAWLLSVDGQISEEFKELLIDVEELPIAELMYRALSIDENGQARWKISTDACLNTAPTETKPDYVKSAILPTLKKHNFPQKFIIPMVGAGVIGISTLVDMWLARTFPLPMGMAYPAHGVTFNKAEAAIHDMIHLQLEDAENTIELMMKLSLSNYPEWSQSPYYWEALENILPHKMARYHSIMGILRNYRDHCQRIFIQAFKQANSEEERTTARKYYSAAITPLFILLHEVDALGASTFNKDTLEDVLNNMRKKMNKSTETEEDLQESFDLFDSLPAGTSDEDIARIFMSQKRIRDIIPNLSEAEKNMTIAEYLEAQNTPPTISIKRVGRNIKLKIEYGERNYFSFSLNHPDVFIASAQDNLNLLRAGGVEMNELPPEHTRESLMEWVRKIDTLSSKMIDVFIRDLGAFVTASDKEAYARIVEAERVDIEKVDAIIAKEKNTFYQIYVEAQKALAAFKEREDVISAYESIEYSETLMIEAHRILNVVKSGTHNTHVNQSIEEAVTLEKEIQKLQTDADQKSHQYEALIQALKSTDLYKEYQRLQEAVNQAWTTYERAGKVE